VGCGAKAIVKFTGESEMAYPKQYRYTKEHEWVDARGDLATIGITDYAQHELGDVVFVELPKPGTNSKPERLSGPWNR